MKLRLLLEEREPGKHTSEIAWTCNNLAILLHADPEQQADAEHLYRQVLNTRSTQEQAAPGSVTADVAIICGNLGILYTQTKGIKAHDLLSEALEINQKLESEYPGVYSSELANSYLNLAGFYVSQNAFDEARPLYIKALNIYNDPTKGHIPEMADIFWNQGILESLANPNNPDARRNFQLAATAWQMVYETIRSRPETDIWDQEELYSTSLKELAASFGDSAPLPDTPALLLFYLQSGSRKNRLLFQEKKHQPSACKS